jgi:magnesium transporter
MGKGNKIPKNGVINYLLTKVPTVSLSYNVGQCLDLIRRKKDWDTINYIYVLNKNKELVGVISVKELLKTKNGVSARKIMKHQPIGIPVSASQERAAVVAIQHNVKMVPIFKAGSREFLGVVGTDKILSILHHEHVEDLLRFSGISKDHPTIDTFKAPPTKLARLRLPWLLLGLIGGMISAFLVSQFGPLLKRVLALAFFIPVVVYIGNAVSTQTQALLIRSLASRKVKISSFLQKELLVSFLLAVTAAIVMSTFAGIWLRSVYIVLTLALAIIFSTLAAVMIGITIPSVLYAAKKDPALGSGPFATAIQDISTLLIYLLIASLIVI